MNINVNFGEILTKAWQVTWKFKVLWIFGILAGCGANRGGNFNNSFSGNSGGSGGGSGSGTNVLPEWLRRFENLRPEEAIRSFLDQYLAIIAGIILFLCVLWFLFYFLGIMGKTGLIRGASQADAGADSLSFGEVWSGSLPYFWRMFGVNLLVGLPFFLVVVVLMAGMIFATVSAAGSGAGEGALVALFGMLGVFFVVICCISIVSLVVGMIVEQVQNAIVLENLGVLEGFGRGWQVFSKNLGSVLVMAIILGVLGFIVSLIVSLPFLLILIPVAASTVITGANNFTTPLLIGGVCFVAYLPVLLVLSGILMTYTQTAWTLTYRRMTAQAQPALPPQFETSNAQ
jgi:hypothetical protein